MNVHDDDGWEVFGEHGGFASRRRRVVGIDPSIGGADRLGASVWEIVPGGIQAPYHFHHVQEELLLVLTGTPTLRSPDGERELCPGDVVFFPRGPAGAHQLLNRGSESARVFFASDLAQAEVAEYPDSGKLRVVTRGESQTGERLAHSFRLDDDVPYFEGEPGSDA